MLYVVNHNATQDWTDETLAALLPDLDSARLARREDGTITFGDLRTAQAFALAMYAEVRRYLVEETGDTTTQACMSLDASSGQACPIYVDGHGESNVNLSVDPWTERLRFGDECQWVAAIVEVNGVEVLVTEGEEVDDDDKSVHRFVELMVPGDGHLEGEMPGLYYVRPGESSWAKANREQEVGD